MSECIGRHETVLLVYVVQENQLETLFKGDDLKALIKTSNCEKLAFHFSEKVNKIAGFATFFFVFSDQTIA